MRRASQVIDLVVKLQYHTFTVKYIFHNTSYGSQNTTLFLFLMKHFALLKHR